MKLSMFAVLFGLLLFAGSTAAYAMPFNMADNNPQVVAYYEDGLHGIPGEYYEHTGQDLVKRNGNSGSFQQWFYGNSENGVHGDHSLWRLAKDGPGSCTDKEVAIYSENNNWGDYLEQNAWYCVKTNDFGPTK